MGFWDKLFGSSLDEIGAPVTGQCVPVSEVSDPTFGEEILGKGIAIHPAEGKVFAPCNASVDMMFETGHAVSLVADNGAEILIHVGLDTVNLKGEHFSIHVASGDHVKKGDLLIEFDKDAIAAKGYDIITPMVICNTDKYEKINSYVDKTVAAGDKVMGLVE